MKIYTFTPSTGQKQYGSQKSIKIQNGFAAMKKAAGAEDMVEISAEAMKRYKNEKQTSLRLVENQTLHKTGKDLKLTLIKNEVSQGTYDFNNKKILGRTAEKLFLVL